MNTRPRRVLSGRASPSVPKAKKSSSGGISSASTSANHSIPGTASTARTNSSTVPTVSNTTTSSGTRSRASICSRARRSSNARCRRSNRGDSRSAWRSAPGWWNCPPPRPFLRRVTGSPGLGRISRGHSGIAWHPRRLRHQRRGTVLPLFQPLGDDRGYITVGEREYVLPLHVESELFPVRRS